jgi:hypothetical protein
VTGDIRLTNADCAEDLDIADSDEVGPGTVVKVAGVISGAGRL